MGKRDAAKMAAVLDPEYTSWQADIKRLKAALKHPEGNDQAALQEELDKLVDMCAQVEEFAKMALLEAEKIIHEKANFTVVGQIMPKRVGEPPGDQVALGWYATQKQALGDALKLTYSSQTHETARAWVVPLFASTPANWYATRKQVQKAEELNKTNWWFGEMERRSKWLEDHPEEQPPADWGLSIPYYTQMDPCPFCDGAGRVPRIRDEEEDA